MESKENFELLQCVFRLYVARAPVVDDKPKLVVSLDCGVSVSHLVYSLLHHVVQDVSIPKIAAVFRLPIAVLLVNRRLERGLDVPKM